MNRPEPAFDFAGRRARALDAIGDRAAMILPAAPEIIIGRDIELRYVVDPDLWYLTGYREPDAVALLLPSGDAPFTLFVRPRDPERETWSGPRGGVEAARERYGAEAAHPIAELAERLPRLLKDVDRVYFRLGTGRGDVEREVLDILAAGRHGRQRTGRGPAELADPGLILDDMRLIKEPAEMALIRDAVDLTVAGMHAGLGAARDGAGEWEVEAAVDGAFRRAGADGPSFATIAASGPNACVLHHIANDRVMRRGELLLLDAGARYRIYAGDLTRTAPVGGRFSGAQRDVYDIVVAANRAAIAAVRPAATPDAVHAAALRVLVQGMVDIDLLHGDVDALMEDEDEVKRYYPHRTSHWLGLDVHDVGTYAVAGAARPLEPGMVLTIEPGLYVPELDENAPAHLRGIGVRVEDDVIVTDDGVEVMSAALPVDPDDVAALV
ncbi:MAG TPA: aminopeptidase P N-terminal domain-containing protein [Longimicrobiales bacterium]|nr:aminopeptidase P N-terminal domain-containing protein [Longimicrobiales bacterium]